MQVCEIIFKRKARFSMKPFCLKKLNDFTFYVSHNLQVLAKYHLMYANYKWYQILLDTLFIVIFLKWQIHIECV